MTDSLGDRIKDQYESRYKFKLPRRTYTIIRLDGKAFHTYCKGMNKPFDDTMVDAMKYATINLCENIQGCVFGYTQSDEISLLLTDFNDIKTQAFFDGNIQKIASVSASYATGYFNQFIGGDKLAFFDSRVFTIPDPTEVENYFIWRQKDCIRNSISSMAQSLYSHKELNGKSSNEKKEMCRDKNQAWEDISKGLKDGFLITKRFTEKYDDKGNIILRSKWVADGAFVFLDDREQLTDLIPQY